MPLPDVAADVAADDPASGGRVAFFPPKNGMEGNLIFLLLGSMVIVGILTQTNLVLAHSVLPLGSGALSGVVDTIPYVETMSPIVDRLVTCTGDLTLNASESASGSSPATGSS